jgi:hypothetical protein
MDLVQTSHGHAPHLGYRNFKKSSSAIRNFVRIYFPLHGLDGRDFLEDFAILLFVESSLYEMDDASEAAIAAGGGVPPRFGKRLRALWRVLVENGLADTSLNTLLADGARFWRLEWKLMCRQLLIWNDIVRAAELRCFDFRILHRVAFRIQKRKYDEELFSTMWPLEVIGDLEEDLRQYIVDLQQDSFNIYRAIAAVDREAAPDRMAELLRSYGREFRQRLRKLPQHQRQSVLAAWRTYRAERPRPEIPMPLPDPRYTGRSGERMGFPVGNQEAGSGLCGRPESI